MAEPGLPPYLASLNPEQLAAVRHEGRPLLILAGAGSGKTRVITTKIAWLVRERGFSPESILAVTFTNKAAREMRDRAALIEPACERSVIRTFHSFGAWFLRRNARAAAESVAPGLSPDFTIYDDEDQAILLHGILPQYTRSECSRFVQTIARAKDYGLEPDSPALAKVSSEPQFRRIYALYEERLRATGNLDFGDLIRLPAKLLEKDEAVRLRTRQRFRVILVDEYQDSNVAQFELLRLLAGGGAGGAGGGAVAGAAFRAELPPAYLCVVGDDDQSIYRFRGAELRNILSFPELFPGTEIIKLERNYRSYQSILDVAGKVVARNAGRLGKTLRAEREGGALPRLALLEDQDQEVLHCARICEERRRKGGRWSDVAILYRTNAQSLGFEKEFPRRGIPYRIVGALRFYEREEVKDVLAYLSLIANPRDEVAFKRVANKPTRGLGDASLEALLEAAGPGGDILQAAASLAEGMKGRAKSGIRELLGLASGLREGLAAETGPVLPEGELGDGALVDPLRGPGAARPKAEASRPKAEASRPKAEAAAPRSEAAKGGAAEAASAGAPEAAAAGEGSLAESVERLIRDSGLLEYHRDQDEIAGTQKVSNLDELVNAASLYPRSRRGLSDFLETIELDRTLSAEDSSADAVTLITMHNTKGLEFPLVIVTGLEQGLFPREDEEGEELEEQRRLFYVAVTRAKDELHLSACRLRRIRGRLFETLPSRFLSEIPPELLKPVPGGAWGGRSRPGLSAGSPQGPVSRQGPAARPVYSPDQPRADRGLPRAGEGRFSSQGGGAGQGGPEREEAAWRSGMAVYHEDYGAGVIIQVKPSPSSGPLVVVRFETGRQAQFFPSFTKKLERQR